MRRMRNLVRLGVRLRRTSFSSTGTSRYYRSRGRKWTQSRNHQTSQPRHQFGQWMHLQLKRLIWCQKTQAPSDKPLSSTPMSVDPTPQFRYMAPIKSKINVSDVISWILSDKVCLSVKE